jgi:uncharacterized protein
MMAKPMTVDSDLTDVLHQDSAPEGPIDPALPHPRPVPSQQLDPKALPAWRINAALGTLFFWIPVLVFIGISWGSGFTWPWSLLLLAGPGLITLIQVVILPPIEWRRWRYEIYEREIDLQRGVLVTTRTQIPMSRVQHVDTQQGPLLRYYGLASVTIATAGGIHEIPGLRTDVADDVRDRIAALAGVADDV